MFHRILPSSTIAAALFAVATAAAAVEPTAPIDVATAPSSSDGLFADDANADAVPNDIAATAADTTAEGPVDIQAAARMDMVQNKREFDDPFTGTKLPLVASDEFAAGIDTTDEGGALSASVASSPTSGDESAVVSPLIPDDPVTDEVAGEAPATTSDPATTNDGATSANDAEAVSDQTATVAETVDDAAAEAQPTSEEDIERIAEEYLEASSLLPAEGIPSPKTGAVKIGASKTEITAMQKALNAAGVDVAVDGRLGKGTTAGLKSFQAKNSLPVTGQLDDATRSKLGLAR